jgi:hypothetical protein
MPWPVNEVQRRLSLERGIPFGLSPDSELWALLQIPARYRTVGGSLAPGALRSGNALA